MCRAGALPSTGLGVRACGSLSVRACALVLMYVDVLVHVRVHDFGVIGLVVRSSAALPVRQQLRVRAAIRGRVNRVGLRMVRHDRWGERGRSALAAAFEILRMRSGS